MQQNDGYGGYVADELLNLRIASKARADGGMTYFRLADGKAESTPLAEVGLEDAQTTSPLAFTVDGKTLYWNDSRGRNTSALLAQDVASGKSTVVAQDPRTDIADALYDTRTGRVQAYTVNFLQQEYLPLTNDLKADLAFLKKKIPGPVHGNVAHGCRR